MKVDKAPLQIQTSSPEDLLWGGRDSSVEGATGQVRLTYGPSCFGISQDVGPADKLGPYDFLGVLPPYRRDGPLESFTRREQEWRSLGNTRHILMSWLMSHAWCCHILMLHACSSTLSPKSCKPLRASAWDSYFLCVSLCLHDGFAEEWGWSAWHY